VCGGAATKLCDFRLGGPIGGYVDGPNGPYAVFDIRRMPYTCDMPLCDACAHPTGRTFVSGPVPAADTIDYCPSHAHVRTRSGDMKPITSQAAAAERAKAWAAARPTAVVTPLRVVRGEKRSELLSLRGVIVTRESRRRRWHELQQAPTLTHNFAPAGVIIESSQCLIADAMKTRNGTVRRCASNR
jgi:hypothetical protein